MDKFLLDVLVDPISKTSLSLHQGIFDDFGNVLTGNLSSGNTPVYPIENGIPRFVTQVTDDQQQTKESFGFKWEQTHTYSSPDLQQTAKEWLIERYGFKDETDMKDYFGSRELILDAGCGGGYSSFLWLEDSSVSRYVGVDISRAIDVAKKRLAVTRGRYFIQADLLKLPFGESIFDTIFSEGVLHHTPSTERALKTVVGHLKPKGEFLFYVYKKKSPIREFTDDHIRNVISHLSPEEAWVKIRPLTKLGQALAELDVTVDVPEDIPYLGIKSGAHDIQRLIYWHFAKLFWNEKFSFEENNHVNFDWYHPRYAHRQTKDEVLQWCQEAGLKIIHFNEQESGFTVRSIKE